MWQKLKVFHLYSETVLLAHVLGWVGVAMEALYQFPDVASSVGLASVVPPAYLGRYTMVIAMLTLGARLRNFHGTDHNQDRNHDHA